MQVLLVDDDANLRALLRTTFDVFDIAVEEAGSAAEARALIRDAKPDVIVLDVMMPKRDGFDVLASLKSNPATRGIPVVLLSARARDEDVWQGWRAGADYYVTKPFNLDELLRFIDQAVDKVTRSRG